MKGSAAIPLALLVLAAIPLLPSVSADTEYDGDLGCMYSMKVAFIFNGENADRVIWDFGDGSETFEGFDTVHEFSTEGVFYVTQTAINEVDGQTYESVAVYRVEIMGYPEISFDSHGGSPVDTIEQTAFKVVAEKPSDPTRDGYTFEGWFKDEELTEPMDWDMLIRTDMTLHAKWSVSEGGQTDAPDTPGDPGSGGDPTDGEVDTDDDRHDVGTNTPLLAGVLSAAIVMVAVALVPLLKRH